MALILVQGIFVEVEETSQEKMTKGFWKLLIRSPYEKRTRTIES
jgi:hypothetical protein